MTLKVGWAMFFGVLFLGVVGCASFGEVDAQLRERSERWVLPVASHPGLRAVEGVREGAPGRFRVRLVTRHGPLVIEVERASAPQIAERFFQLARIGYFDGAPFFRVEPGFIVQFGLHGEPEITKAWRTSYVTGSLSGRSNVRGTIACATVPGDFNTCSNQFFINVADNTELDGEFIVFGEVVLGVEVLDQLYGEYRGRVNQERLERDGDVYLEAEFPLLDRIERSMVSW